MRRVQCHITYYIFTICVLLQMKSNIESLKLLIFKFTEHVNSEIIQYNNNLYYILSIINNNVIQIIITDHNIQ